MNFIHKDIGVNNRRKREEITSSIGYLKFQRTDGSTKNLLINMACHPVILGASNLEISSDYVFYLRNILEEQTGAEVIFLSADLGDKNPPPIGYLRKGTFSDASAFAETAASAILETQEGSQELDISHIAVYTEKTFAPIENKEYARIWQLGNPISRQFHPDLEVRRGSKALYLTYAELGDLVLVTSPGESTTAHRKALAERLGLGDHLYLDITNGYSGYILTKGEWNPHGDEERRNKWISKEFSDQIIQTYSSAVSRITRE